MSKEVYLHVFFSEPMDMLVVSAETIQGVGKMLKERPRVSGLITYLSSPSCDFQHPES